jgi:tRNA nucleotidyltransferase/poly(A) polymerase
MNLPEDPAASGYAGRWVAVLRGRIVAQGETRETALQAARALRFKEIPQLVYMSEASIFLTSPLMRLLRDSLPPDQTVYLVGGAVRDIFLMREIHDLDLAVPSGALALAKQLANRLKASFFPLDIENDTARVVIIREDGARDTLDFAGFRGPDLENDLRGRDFTLNALAVDLRSGELSDPLGGLPDLRARRLRACSPTALQDDPVRILRAVRQAASFGLSIESETRQQMKEAVPQLNRVSPERLRDELFKMLAGPAPDACLRALDLLGVLPHLLPELPVLKGVTQSPPHIHDVWNHTLAVLRHLESILAALAPHYDEEKGNADLFNGLLVKQLGRYRAQIGEHLANTLNTDRSARSLLFFAALYHDIEKPSTRTVEESGRIRYFGHDERGARTAVHRAIAMRLSNDEIDRARTIIAQHMTLKEHTRRKQDKNIDPSRKAIYRFFRQAGPAGVEIVLLGLADTRATYDHTLPQEHWAASLEVARTFLEAWWERPEELVRPPQLLNGHDLMTELGLPPGRQVGQMLEAIREAQAAGQFSTREEALNFARAQLAHKK